MDTKVYPVTHTEAEWRKLLSPEQFHIMREHGTERPGSCALNFEKRAGTFTCAGCEQELVGRPSADQRVGIASSR